MSFEIWTLSAEPILIYVKRAYLITKSPGHGIRKVQDDLAKPDTKVDMVAFDGMVLEPHKDHVNIWQFRVIEDGIIEGRPTGGSRSEHRRIVDETTGQLRSRKQGEWYKTPWVPQGAVKAAAEETM